ncbi:DUF418 domain-containing protein [Nocardiopsis ansamitocini]|uniref:DUF418 domain-containing protein n=1 Tax=Nocardiopsis ansamitocini TaxID=1670832 RepID=A0A9W6UKI0_9ACTN|nr:DUF418 domain-containing protein [Nocardiopsis ansamitocini]GLU49085.1 hypothetical protein Nans01_34360 [Nocardiopsis ansamitocini]
MDPTTARRAGAPVERSGGEARKRLPLLDVLRGVAILGTLATNVWIFALPGAEAGPLFDPDAFSPVAGVSADPSVGTVLAETFRFAANGKFLAMLALLFGVGLAIQYRSATSRGRRWPGSYPRRALFLFVEGAVHFTLVFAWDVLMGYAVTALLVAWLLARTERVQKAALWTAAVLHGAMTALVTGALVLVEQAAPAGNGAGGAPADVVALYAEGSYAEQIAFRLDNVLLLRVEPVVSFPLLVLLFLVGVLLLRAGAFGDDTTGRRIRARLMAWGLGVGLPLNVATTLAGPSFFFADRYLAAPLFALGLIGLIGWGTDRVRSDGPLVTGLSSLGRTAMSGYVLQNVLCVLACYGIGLGLAERLEGTGPWWVFGLWATVCAVLLVGSTLWLRRFSQGPLEALQKWTSNRLPQR